LEQLWGQKEARTARVVTDGVYYGNASYSSEYQGPLYSIWAQVPGFQWTGYEEIYSEASRGNERSQRGSGSSRTVDREGVEVVQELGVVEAESLLTEMNLKGYNDCYEIKYQGHSGLDYFCSYCWVGVNPPEPSIEDVRQHYGREDLILGRQLSSEKESFSVGAYIVYSDFQMGNPGDSMLTHAGDDPESNTYRARIYSRYSPMTYSKYGPKSVGGEQKVEREVEFDSYQDDWKVVRICPNNAKVTVGPSASGGVERKFEKVDIKKKETIWVTGFGAYPGQYVERDEKIGEAVVATHQAF
jgi:hypothetical protein